MFRACCFAGGVDDRQNQVTVLAADSEGCHLFALEGALWLRSLPEMKVRELVALADKNSILKGRGGCKTAFNPTSEEEDVYYHQLFDAEYPQLCKYFGTPLLDPNPRGQLDVISYLEHEVKDGTYVLHFMRPSHHIAVRKLGNACLIVENCCAIHQVPDSDRLFWLPFNLLPSAYVSLSLSRDLLEVYKTQDEKSLKPRG